MREYLRMRGSVIDTPGDWRCWIKTPADLTDGPRELPGYYHGSYADGGVDRFAVAIHAKDILIAGKEDAIHTNTAQIPLNHVLSADSVTLTYLPA